MSLIRRASSEAKAFARIGARRPILAVRDVLPVDSGEVWSAVRRLPKRQAQAIALRYLEEMSLEEIAHVLGCSKSTVNTHLRRGREKLAVMLNLEDE